MATMAHRMSDFASISELAPRLRRREISPVELTRGCLARIEKANPSLNSFVTVMSESALVQARTAEGEIGRGEWRGTARGSGSAERLDRYGWRPYDCRKRTI